MQCILESFDESNGYNMVRRFHRKDHLSIFALFCYQLTYDLILRHRDISRLNIHRHRFYYTYRKIIRMNASFYPILPSEVFFHKMDCQLYLEEEEKADCVAIIYCYYICLWLFLTVSWVCLQYVIVVFLDRTPYFSNKQCRH